MENSLCISSRVRLARNICGYPFCNKLSDPQALGIIDEVRGALGNDYSYINFSHLSNEKKNVFVEKPICLNEDEAELLLKTDNETGAKVQDGQVIRFWD
jgi:protein-arginine kinase